MAYLRNRDHINCESCGKNVEVGKSVYMWRYPSTVKVNPLLVLCERCVDERLEDYKAEIKETVNADNFELEEEI